MDERLRFIARLLEGEKMAPLCPEFWAAPRDTESRQNRPAMEYGSRPMLHRLRLQPDNRLAFLRGFLQQPHLVGSVIPSSRFLERRLVEIAEIGRAGLVVELGPGTGGTTRAMLRALPESGRLLAIELNPRFVSHLRAQSDPRLIAHAGSAAEIQTALDLHRLPRPDVVISGIPFSTMPTSLGRSIIEAVWRSLAPGGSFVAYQFRDRVAVLGRQIAGEPEVTVEPLNVPPIRIFRWRKPDRSSGAG